MKVRLGITYGLEPKSKRDFSFRAPRILSSNFKMEDVETSVKLESNAPLTSNVADGAQRKSGSNYIYQGSMAPSTETGWQFVAHRSADFTGYSARATHSLEDMVISERLTAPSAGIQKLAIVIDGSKAIATQIDGIKKSLAQLPKSVRAKVFIADHRDQVEALEVKEAIERLSAVDLGGGVDNVPALKGAAKFIGRHDNAAILWIHGEQPILFPEDKDSANELMVRGTHRIKLYDVQVGADAPNAIEGYLSSLSASACPEVRSIAQSNSIQNDLSKFLSSAGAEGTDLQVVREKIPNKHMASTSYDFPIASRLSTVWAADEARKCDSFGDIATAELLGNVYRVVTPATGAVVLETESDYSHESLKRNFYSVVNKNAHAKNRGIADGTSTLDRDDAQPDQSSFVAGADKASRSDVVEEKSFAGEFERRESPWTSSAPQSNSATSWAVPSAAPSPAPMPGVGGAPKAERASFVPPPPPFFASKKAQPTALEQSIQAFNVPSLAGATNGTIGPQFPDATFVTSAGAAPSPFDWQYYKSAAWSELACVFGGILMVFAGIYFLGRGFLIHTDKNDAVNGCVAGSVLIVLAQLLLRVMMQS